MHDVHLQTDRLRALIFDVDGTLYRQSTVRRAMAARLLLTHWTRPRAGVRTIRVLAAYRRAQETLRAERFCGDVAAAQVGLAAEQTDTDPADVATLARRWMDDGPLDVLARSMRPGLLDLLEVAVARGLKLAAVSDYPAHDKLHALGLADRFEVVLSAQDPQVSAFKPDPRGLLVALDELGVDHTEALYIGDRVDVDAAAAAAADVRCVLVGASQQSRSATTPSHVDFASLASTLEQR